MFVLLRDVYTQLVLTTTCFGRYIGHHQVVHSLIFKANYVPAAVFFVCTYFSLLHL